MYIYIYTYIHVYQKKYWHKEGYPDILQFSFFLRLQIPVKYLSLMHPMILQVLHTSPL